MITTGTEKNARSVHNYLWFMHTFSLVIFGVDVVGAGFVDLRNNDGWIFK